LQTENGQMFQDQRLSADTKQNARLAKRRQTTRKNANAEGFAPSDIS